MHPALAWSCLETDQKGSLSTLRLVNRPSKEFIVQEIRRCAAENGGKPLGRARFQAETGIRETDWSGRYWTLWSDVVRDAGYEPNRLQGRVLDDAGLLDCLARLTVELGRFPTAPDLRMRHRVQMGFTEASGKAPIRWVAIHHGVSTNGNDHIHIAATMVREDGVGPERTPGCARVAGWAGRGSR